MKQNESIIRLFKGVLIAPQETTRPMIFRLENYAKEGFMFTPLVLTNYSTEDLNEIATQFKKEYGLTPEELNSSFHKSWEKVANAGDRQLFLEQITHYFTTYGFEALGIDSDYVYIPKERLNIPALDEDVKLLMIKGYTKEELKVKALNMCESGIALKESTMNDLMVVFKLVGMESEDIEKIKNKEIKIRLYDMFNIAPKNPSEFLRYLVYKSTGETLIIKNNKLVAMIKGSKLTQNYLAAYIKQFGAEPLAGIFNRYKRLFLAFKECGFKSEINKISKLSKTCHKPMKEDYLNRVTHVLKSNESFSLTKLEEGLVNANVFRKIRLANSLMYRMSGADAILYRVRNGKGYAKPLKENCAKIMTNIVLNTVLQDIAKGLNLVGKKVYIPSEINYALPSTEKQFIGNIPSGSSVFAKENMIVGVHWSNIENNRIDLDFSMQSKFQKIGWNTSCRTGQRDVLYSGDLTDAQNGATESFYMRQTNGQIYQANLNYYNHSAYSGKLPVPFKLFVAEEKAIDFGKDYTVNPNNVLMSVNMIQSEKQKSIGLTIPVDGGNRFFFTDTDIGGSNVSGSGEYQELSRKALVKEFESKIGLRDLLQFAKCKLVNSQEEAEIDLSIDSLEKDTFINLLTGKTELIKKVEAVKPVEKEMEIPEVTFK